MIKTRPNHLDNSSPFEYLEIKFSIILKNSILNFFGIIDLWEPIFGKLIKEN